LAAERRLQISSIGLRADSTAGYDSIMCSTAAQRIAEIGRAIDDLAVKAAPTASEADPVVARLAELWALLAELDPEVARRLAGYQALSARAELGRSARRICHTAESGRALTWPGSPCCGSDPRSGRSIEHLHCQVFDMCPEPDAG
jgi:hypothetical protein